MVFSMNHQPVTPKTSAIRSSFLRRSRNIWPWSATCASTTASFVPWWPHRFMRQKWGWKTHETTSRNGWKAPTKTSEMDGKIWNTWNTIKNYMKKSIKNHRAIEHPFLSENKQQSWSAPQSDHSSIQQLDILFAIWWWVALTKENRISNTAYDIPNYRSCYMA